MAVPQTSPSPWAAWVSPIENKAQTKTGDICRPAKAGRRKPLDGDFQRVTGFGPLDIDGTGHRVDFAKIQGCHISDSAVRRQLARRAVVALELDRFTRGHPKGRDKRVVPAEMMACAVNGVVRTFIAHRLHTHSHS